MATIKEFSFEKAKSIGEQLGINWDIVSLEEFRVGLSVELEHGAQDPETDVTHDDLLMTGKIAWVHIKEISDYYTRLSTMQNEAKEKDSTI
jgi:hypothetical protein